MVDVIATLSAPLAPGSDTPAPIELRPGGSAANTAAWAARAGAPAIFVGRVGDDDFGRRAVSTLQEAGVATYVTVEPHWPTGLCLVLVGPDGERTMVPSTGANANLQPEDLPDVATGDLWHLSGYVLSTRGHAPRAGHPGQGRAGGAQGRRRRLVGAVGRSWAQRFSPWWPASTSCWPTATRPPFWLTVWNLNARPGGCTSPSRWWWSRTARAASW
jgi:hypothetical protein